MNLDRRSVDDWEWATLCLALDLLAGGDFDKAREAVRTWETYRERKPAPRKRATATEKPSVQSEMTEVERTIYQAAIGKAQQNAYPQHEAEIAARKEDEMLPAFLDRRGGAA